ncbi:MAG: glutamate--tRNA ligase family protein [Verrucomicrobiota bacterium]
MDTTCYRGRMAPSPTGYLHLGHARTFWVAQQRARQNAGALIFRNEDLDSARCKKDFVTAMYEDLRWFGLEWSEGPDRGGACSPYSQSERYAFYRTAFEKLRAGGFVYPCFCSRRDVLRSLQAPHQGEDEPIYPGTCRERFHFLTASPEEQNAKDPRFSWRFRVNDGETISFLDKNFGSQKFVAGKDFGDFVIWRHDNIPAYQLAVVADDIEMKISEVVRGADLLLSTAR